MCLIQGIHPSPRWTPTAKAAVPGGRIYLTREGFFYASAYSPSQSWLRAWLTDHPGLRREKHQGHYVYFSSEPGRCAEQKKLLHQLGMVLPERLEFDRECSEDLATG
jgi:hypothetical protein